jgi:hypothetical protein
MKLRITKAYCWHSPEINIKNVVMMYFVNSLPFTWDDLTEEEEADPSTIIEANNLTYTAEDLFRASAYLIMEEAHPCFFEMDLENPEVLAELDDY